MKKIILTIIYAVFTFSVTNSQWIKTSGPPGGTVTAISPSGPNLLAGTAYGGVYWSSNFGISWNQSISLNNAINTSGFLNYGSKVFAPVNKGVYFSSDNGQNWSPTSLNNHSVTCLAANDSFIFAGTNTYYGIYRSSDSGSSWSQTGLNSISTFSIFTNGEKIYAGATDLINQFPALYVSTNNGLNWTQTSLTNHQVNCMAAIDSTIIAGTSSGLFVSTDEGITWNFNLNAGIYSLFVSGQNIYAGAGGGLFRSTDNGQNWALLSLSGKTVYALYSIGSNFYAGTLLYGVFFSIDYGNNWVQLPLYCQNVYCLMQNNSDIYAGTIYGLYTTQSEGQIWTLTSLHNAPVYSLAFDLPYIYAAGSKMFVSSDGGANWIITHNSIFRTVAVFGSRVLAGAGNGIFISTDHGQNWVHTFVNPIECILTKNQIVYAGTGNGFSKSLDSGMTFTQIFSRNGVYCGTIEDSTFYIGTRDSGVYISTNNGGNWTHSPLNNLNVVSIAASNSLVLAGTRFNGVFKSTDKGSSWIEINDGMGPVPVPSLLMTNTNVFAGTMGSSVWKRPISQILGSAKISNTTPDKYLLYQNYPNPFNPVTKIKFSLPSPSKGGVLKVKLIIYDVLGRKVANLIPPLWGGQEGLAPGTYEVDWDGTNYPSGVYFYKLVTDGFSVTKKMVLVK